MIMQTTVLLFLNWDFPLLVSELSFHWSLKNYTSPIHQWKYNDKVCLMTTEQAGGNFISKKASFVFFCEIHSLLWWECLFFQVEIFRPCEKFWSLASVCWNCLVTGCGLKNKYVLVWWIVWYQWGDENSLKSLKLSRAVALFISSWIRRNLILKSGT